MPQNRFSRPSWYKLSSEGHKHEYEHFRAFQGQMLNQNERNENQMTRKELLKLAEQAEEKIRLDKELYFKPGIDNTARMFLHSIKENSYHKNRKKKFESYTGYQQRY